MSRLARVVLPGGWHHVTQRGNRQQDIFSTPSDRSFYLSLLRHYCARDQVRIAGYFLMTNHIHLLASPARECGLAKALGRAHNDYARWWNLRNQVSGHLWQNRFFSCPLDDAHTWAALLYVERNPVRAGIVHQASDWSWSSARAHLTGADDTRLLDWADWRERWTSSYWQEALEFGLDEAALAERLREATKTGRPAGSPEFVTHLAQVAGRRLSPTKPGPKPRSGSQDP